MAAAFTFGSLGDILTLCQLGVQLGTALSSSRGSSKDYLDFRNDVDAYGAVLMKVSAPPCFLRLHRVGKRANASCFVSRVA